MTTISDLEGMLATVFELAKDAGFTEQDARETAYRILRSTYTSETVSTTEREDQKPQNTQSLRRKIIEAMNTVILGTSGRTGHIGKDYGKEVEGKRIARDYFFNLLDGKMITYDASGREEQTDSIDSPVLQITLAIYAYSDFTKGFVDNGLFYDDKEAREKLSEKVTTLTFSDAEYARGIYITLIGDYLLGTIPEYAKHKKNLESSAYLEHRANADTQLMNDLNGPIKQKVLQIAGGMQ